MSDEGYENICKLPFSGESPVRRAAHHCHNRCLPVENGLDFVFEILKTFIVMTPFDNCFSAGMCLRIEMRYMPTGSVLQVFLQNVTSYSSLCYF